MGRPTAASARELTPAEWPDWLLSFGGSYNATNPDRQQSQRDAFHAWLTDKAAWFAAHGLAPSWVDVDTERRRRREGQRPPAVPE